MNKPSIAWSLAKTQRLPFLLPWILLYVFTWSTVEATESEKQCPGCGHTQSQEIPNDEAQTLKIECSQKSISHLLRSLKNLEQICTFGSVKKQKEIASFVRQRMTCNGQILEKKLTAEGFPSSDPPPGWDGTHWDEQEKWLEKLKKSSDPTRCELLQMALGVTLFRLSTLPPSYHICNDFDAGCFPSSDASYKKDYLRALWEYRYFLSFPKYLISKDSNPNCESEKIYWDAHTRLEALRKESKRNYARRPLGVALGMCARPMNGHLLDSEIVDRKIPRPAGWSPPQKGIFFKKKYFNKEEILKIENALSD